MKILIISAVFPPEPVVSAQLSNDLANILSLDNDVVVISPKPTRPLGFVFKNCNEEKTFKHIIADSYTCPESKMVGRFRESFSFGLYIKQYIKNNYKEIDAIYINSWPLFSQYFAVKVANRYKIPVITHIQDIYPDSLASKFPTLIGGIINFLLRPIDKYVLSKSTSIICISPNMISYLSATRKIPCEKFTLVRNWQDDLKFKTNLKDENESSFFKYVYVGSISPSASIETLIYGFHKANIKNTQLIIAGSGSDKNKCQEIVAKIKTNSIIFKDVSPETVSEIQNDSNVLLLSLKKNIAKNATPSKLTAYLFSKRAIIACVEQETDVANIILNSKAGLVVPPEDVNALSIAMTEMYNSKNRISMGELGFQYAENNLSKKSNLTILKQEIENVCLQYRH